MQIPSPTLTAYMAQQRVARLATAGADGKPSLVPVCFVYHVERIFIALDAKPKSVPAMQLKRVRNILENPNVAFLVDSYYEDWARLTYVLISGTAALEEPGTEAHTAAVALLRAKYPQYRAMPIESQPFITITPLNTHTWQGAPNSTRSSAPDAHPSRSALDFASLARARHVVRRYQQIEVPRALVEQTLEAARWAPSPHGMQPWRFVVITKPSTKLNLADAMSAEWTRNLEMDGESAEVVEARLRKSRNRVLNTPVLIIPCLYMAGMHEYPDPARAVGEETMAVQSIGAAIQNMLLSAYSLGLDTGWMCAPLFCPEAVRAALNLDPAMIPHALIQLGYGSQDPPRRPHRPVSELVVMWD